MERWMLKLLTAEKRAKIAGWRGVVKVPRAAADDSGGMFWGLILRMQDAGHSVHYERPSGFGPAWVWFGDVPKDQRPACGARTRKGTPCQARAVAGMDRCRLHGGLSSGPKTPEGRARIAESNRRRAAERRAGRVEKLEKLGTPGKSEKQGKGRRT